MKLYAIILSAGLSFGGLALAQAPSTQPSDAKPVNKICPVSGEAIDGKGPTLMYEGKLIGFCCADCPPEFKKDPEKYMKKLK